MSGLVPINANAHSSVEIDGSCNDCCSCCWPRKIKADPRKPQEPQFEITPTWVRVKSASEPVLKQTGEEEWEIMIDGRKITTEPTLKASSANLDIGAVK